MTTTDTKPRTDVRLSDREALHEMLVASLALAFQIGDADTGDGTTKPCGPGTTSPTSRDSADKTATGGGSAATNTGGAGANSGDAATNASNATPASAAETGAEPRSIPRCFNTTR